MFFKTIKLINTAEKGQQNLFVTVKCGTLSHFCFFLFTGSKQGPKVHHVLTPVYKGTNSSALKDLHQIVNVPEIWLCILAFGQDGYAFQTLFSHLSTHFFFLCIRYWIHLLGMAALDSDTGWCHTPGCSLPLSWHLIMFGMASWLFMDVATSVMRQLLPFTWHRSDAVFTHYSVTALFSGLGSTARIMWWPSVCKIGVVVLLQHWCSQTAAFDLQTAQFKNIVKQSGQNFTLDQIANKSLNRFTWPVRFL